MLNLSSAAIIEKNKLSSTGAWLILVEIDFDGIDPIRLAYNTENIVWSAHTWMAFPFELREMSEDSKGRLPSLEIRVSNVSRALMPYVEQSQGGVGAKVIVRVVHSDHLDLVEPELEETFTIVSCAADAAWVTFTLGAESPLLQRCPKQRFLKDHCRYKEFKGAECGYSGPETTCNRTFKQCVEYGNQARFGGFPGIPTGGVYA